MKIHYLPAKMDTCCNTAIIRLKAGRLEDVHLCLIEEKALDFWKYVTEDSLQENGAEWQKVSRHEAILALMEHLQIISKLRLVAAVCNSFADFLEQDMKWGSK